MNWIELDKIRLKIKRERWPTFLQKMSALYVSTAQAIAEQDDGASTNQVELIN